MAKSQDKPQARTEAKAQAKAPLYFYHVVPFDQVRCGKLVACPSYSDEEDRPSFHWLEKELGYYPLFLAIGEEDAAYVTGYQNQWRCYLGETFIPPAPGETKATHISRYRKAGEYPNMVLFGFAVEDVPVHNLHDYQWWCIVLGDVFNKTPIGKMVYRCLFKKSWSQSRWLRQARKDSHLVQGVCPELDLDRAQFIWVRNEATRRALIARGFDGDRVRVKRLLLQDDK